MRVMPNKLLQKSDSFYQKYFFIFLIALTSEIIILVALSGLILYQVTHRPLPVFTALAPNGKQLQLTSYHEPNYMPDTITQWASKAAITSYTFDFAHYNQQLILAKPYFTEAGWQAYLDAIKNVIQSVVDKQLIINGVVNGAPVISNESELPNNGYTWRVQLPFIVTTQSADAFDKKSFTVILTLVKIPTDQNPFGIGIDQFVMLNRGG